MKKPVTALVAAGALGLASVSTQPAHAMDPWTAAAWFVGGMFVGGVIVAPAFAHGPYGAYGYRAPHAYAPVYAGWTPQRCYTTQIQRGGAWYPARVCY